MRPPLLRVSHRYVARRASLSQRHQSLSTSSTPQNLIQIRDGTFYREHPSVTRNTGTANPPFFKGLSFALPVPPVASADTLNRKQPHWAIIGAGDSKTFLDVLRGDLICVPPNARTYPYLSTNEITQKDPQLSLPSRAIQYVGFSAKQNGASGSGTGGIQGAYLSARYESRREETDWTVLQHLKGDTELNPSTQLSRTVQDDDPLLAQVIKDLRLEKLLSMPVSNLSNGQSRRCRIAKALLSRPQLLLLDEPFMGLDPPTLVSLSPMLKDLAYRSSPLLILGLRPQDAIPDWITNLVILDNNRGVSMMGEKEQVLFSLARWADMSRRSSSSPQSELWLELMDRAHGRPLDGVGDSLTASGIKSYTTYDQAKEQERKYFDGIYVRQRVLDLELQKRWEAASKTADAQRTIGQWTALIASLPADFRSNNALSQDIVAKDQSLSATPSKPVSSDPSSSFSSLHQSPTRGEPLIQLENLILKYGSKTVLGHPPPQPGYDNPGINLTVRRGSRLALLGPNGSGKTTLLSLLTSDHPQSYSLPMKFFGRSRLPSRGKPGLSLWEIQKRIGHSAPEVHAFFPKRLTIRQVLESSWAETYSSSPDLNEERNRMVDSFLRFWAAELKQSLSWHPGKRDVTTSVEVPDDVAWAKSNDFPFAVLPFSTQRLLLLLRAVIKQPDIIVLDEAFSGLPSTVRDKAMSFLEHGELNPNDEPSSTDGAERKILFKGLTDQQAIIVVSHLREEIPYSINEWIRLPSEEEATEMGRGVEMGVVSTGQNGGGIRDAEGWNAVWRL